jgi:hypothetical protein
VQAVTYFFPHDSRNGRLDERHQINRLSLAVEIDDENGDREFAVNHTEPRKYFTLHFRPAVTGPLLFYIQGAARVAGRLLKRRVAYFLAPLRDALFFGIPPPFLPDIEDVDFEWDWPPRGERDDDPECSV